MQEGCIQGETAQEKSLLGCCSSQGLEPAKEMALQGAPGSVPLPLAPSVPGLGVPLRERSQQLPRDVKGEPWSGSVRG